MPHIGHIGEFNHAEETLDMYLERLDEYIVANNIGKVAPDASQEAQNAAARQKSASLLSIVGKNTYSILRDLVKPEKPSDKTYQQLCETLRDHFQPKTIEVAETFKFHRCMQHENETINVFTARLRGMASSCNFGGFLARALRDQFVSGIRCRDTQKKLLSADKTFEECVKIAIADEAATKETFSFSTPQAEVNLVSKHKKEKKFPRSSRSSDTNSGYACYSCGGQDHKRDDCKWRNAVCHSCKRRGHISRICKAGVKLLEEEHPYTEEEEIAMMSYLMTIGDYTDGIFVPVNIEGKDCKLQLDTGASKTVVPKSFYDKYCADAPLNSTKTVLKTYTNETVYPVGRAIVKVCYQGKKFELPLIVVNKGSTAVFGRDWLSKIKLNWKDLAGLNYVTEKKSAKQSVKQNVNVPANVKGLNCVLDEFGELFDEKLGCYTGSAVELNVHTQPPFCKARPVPFAMQMKVKQALDKMESNGVIKKVKSSTCAAPIVAVLKEKH